MDSLALDRAKRLAAVLSGRIFHRAIHGPLGRVLQQRVERLYCRTRFLSSWPRADFPIGPSLVDRRLHVHGGVNQRDFRAPASRAGRGAGRF